MIMEIETLRSFITIAQEENITRAAEYLHLTQPTLSRQIKSLEEEFGKQLLIRGKRQVTLTEDGMVFRKRASEILALIDKTNEEMKASRKDISGDIYIGAAETDVMRLISKIAGELKKKYPGIRYRIISGDGDAVKEMLNKGLIDFGLVFGPVDEKKYDAIPINIDDNWGVLMPEKSSLAKKQTVSPKDLWDKPLILSQQAIDGGFLQTWLKKDLSDLDVAATYTLILNAAKMVEGGLGYAMVIDGLINTYNTGIVYRPCLPHLSAKLNILSKKYQIFTLAAQAFRDLLIENHTLEKD
jgi:DNA-binding transcriptional LysR family regulator